MIVILKAKTNNEEIKKLTEEIEKLGVNVNPVIGTELSILGLVGDTTKIDPTYIEANPNVERVMHVQEPFKKANRMFHPEPTVIDVNGQKIGGKKLAIMAGPCSVENEKQITLIAEEVKKSGANFLRGGAFKPRTSPYSFQGLGKEGIDLLIQARKITGLPIVTEIMDLSDLDCFADVDVVQVGARNMQNFDLLRAVGRLNVPVLLKRGLSATIDEWLMSAEYIMSEGNQNVILCERGIRTFEKATRNTLDLSAVTVVKRRSHLPVIVDPSHATGHRWMVEDMAMAAIAAGADGIMCEVHNDPEHAWCDGAESITPETFDHLMGRLRQLAPIVGREL